MYIPSSFAESDPEKLHACIRRHSFALLVSQAGGEPLASHLPLLLAPTVGAQGRLLGHMARANPQWREADGQSVLAIFSGPHAYISPTWYAAQNVVPTWNYVAVHVYGRIRIEHDRNWLLEIVRRTVDEYESTLPQPWSIAATEPGFVEKLLDSIVGFTIEIERIEGKWKLSQNQPAERREKVVAALQAAGGHEARQVAALMEALHDERH